MLNRNPSAMNCLLNSITGRTQQHVFDQPARNCDDPGDASQQTIQEKHLGMGTVKEAKSSKNQQTIMPVTHATYVTLAFLGHV